MPSTVWLRADLGNRKAAKIHGEVWFQHILKKTCTGEEGTGMGDDEDACFFRELIKAGTTGKV